jgi:hypothetical protein
MERISSTSTTLQSIAPNPIEDLEVEVTPAVVVSVEGREIIYLGIHGGIPPWIWESL